VIGVLLVALVAWSLAMFGRQAAVAVLRELPDAIEEQAVLHRDILVELGVAEG
jgi:hypothetical protein